MSIFKKITKKVWRNLRDYLLHLQFLGPTTDMALTLRSLECSEITKQYEQSGSLESNHESIARGILDIQHQKFTLEEEKFRPTRTVLFICNKAMSKEAIPFPFPTCQTRIPPHVPTLTSALATSRALQCSHVTTPSENSTK